jgi:NADH dehydrogenase
MSRIAITGGTGFVGRHLAAAMVRAGHHVVLVARGRDQRDPAVRALPNTSFVTADLADGRGLDAAFAGCDAVAHLAGINRELGRQSFQRIHVDGTRQVIDAARRVGVAKIVFLSFLRARPACGSPYHESKWAAEEMVRASGLDYTILKAGVIYGRGDHMLDHLSHAMHSLPVFALVGLRDRPVQPVAVEDVARVLCAALVEGRLERQTVAVLGPERLLLGEAVRRVARTIGRQPLMFSAPVWLHVLLAWLLEQAMVVPLVALAQVRILSEGIVEAAPPCAALPADLLPTTPFCSDQIARGLPAPGGFGWRDCRWVAWGA